MFFLLLLQKQYMLFGEKKIKTQISKQKKMKNTHNPSTQTQAL